MIKDIIKHLFRNFGLEISRISTNDIQATKTAGLNPLNLGIRELSIMRALSAEGHISMDEARFLSRLVQKTDKQEPIIEIGTLFGYSTLVICMAKRIEQKMLTVDSYVWNPLGLPPVVHEAATRSILKDTCFNHNVEVLRQDKDIFYKNYKGPAPGLFFCDADHGYEPTLNDLSWARSVGSKIICGHDYDPNKHPGVVKAVKELGGASEVVGTLFVL